jgi:hypothetical protein
MNINENARFSMRFDGQKLQFLPYYVPKMIVDALI